MKRTTSGSGVFLLLQQATIRNAFHQQTIYDLLHYTLFSLFDNTHLYNRILLVQHISHQNNDISLLSSIYSILGVLG